MCVPERFFQVNDWLAEELADPEIRASVDEVLAEMASE